MSTGYAVLSTEGEYDGGLVMLGVALVPTEWPGLRVAYCPRLPRMKSPQPVPAALNLGKTAPSLVKRSQP